MDRNGLKAETAQKNAYDRDVGVASFLERNNWNPR